MISIWPWSRINELTMEVLRQRGIACKVRSERDCALDELDRVEAVAFAVEDYQVERINQVDRSRRGWKWLYEQKCEQWRLNNSNYRELFAGI